MRYASNVGTMATMSTETLPQRRKIPRDSFALRLISVRHELGMSQEQIADLCGVKRPTWATWENGSIPRNMAEQAQKISKATGYDRDWLLYGSEEQDHGPDPTPPLASMRSYSTSTRDSATELMQKLSQVAA